MGWCWPPFYPAGADKLSCMLTMKNTFEQPETVPPAACNEFAANDQGFTANLPAKSVIVLEIE